MQRTPEPNEYNATNNKVSVIREQEPEGVAPYALGCHVSVECAASSLKRLVITFL